MDQIPNLFVDFDHQACAYPSRMENLIQLGIIAALFAPARLVVTV